MDLTGCEPPVEAIGDNYLYELPNQGKKGTQSRFFLTTRSLHRTRVWEAIEVKSRKQPTPVPNAKPVVLKDAWIDENRLTELAIQTQLFDDIRAFAATPDWRGHPLLGKLEDADKDRLGSLFEGEKFKDLFLRAALEHKSRTRVPLQSSCDSKELKASADDETSGSNTKGPKTRVVTIFGEVCTALDDLPTLGDAMDIMNQCLVALQLMMVAGWVHRDISAGNILAYRAKENDRWSLKLADLEYAKKCSFDTTTYDSRVGTSFFMPWEIQNCLRVTGNFRTPRGLNHDYQHDLESLWWIWLWIITCRIQDHPGSRKVVAGLFEELYDHNPYRKLAWAHGIEGLETHIHPYLQVFPPIVDRLRHQLGDLSLQHVAASAEANYERCSEAHVLFRRELDNTEEDRAVWGPVKLKANKPDAGKAPTKMANNPKASYSGNGCPPSQGGFSRAARVPPVPTKRLRSINDDMGRDEDQPELPKPKYRKKAAKKQDSKEGNGNILPLTRSRARLMEKRLQEGTGARSERRR
ncbi:hypothetical protein DFP72DRAFT_1063783 [Ephemerocybe angulata]|uniref:Protein kinase domain-containing protein n=1 Tax=Ephemerocybe angulata TaxID=980116 RepID=A0A8H6M856_9AGAR|nr:hypothetical protein DFP72DRAFT_1063783 [Tulosesus angulatus]